MTPSTPVQDLATQWKLACRLYPTYFELAREFAIDVKPCPELEAGTEAPGKDVVEQANRWLAEMDNRIQVHQLRQFLQTNAAVTQDGLQALLEHFLAKTPRTEALRDKIDFLLVQYFSQIAPSGLKDAEVDLAYAAQALEPVLGTVDLKAPVWLNALDRVLDSARQCRSLDELLHGGVLEQGRKAKGLAGELFYLPVALAAFARFGYLMRRAFFRLMLGDLNIILDGLTELEEKGVTTIDCRRAQFSEKEPIVRLRMICQSWKVMFQAEYSSGSPLRMLVDLRASVEQALGRGKASQPPVKGVASQKPAAPAAAKTAQASKPAVGVAPKAPVTAAAKPVTAAKPATAPVAKPPVPAATKTATVAGAAAAAKPAPKSTAAPKAVSPAAKPVAKPMAVAPPKPKAKAAAAGDQAPEFEVSGSGGWDPDAAQGKKH